MKLSEYAEAAHRTAKHPTRSREEQIPVMALGLGGEAGECAEIVKKYTAHGMPRDAARVLLRDELGDVLWYLVELADHFDIDINDVASDNIKKLEKRHPDGFKPRIQEGEE